MAVVGGDHGQAGEAAFGRLRLPDDGQVAAAAKFKKLIMITSARCAAD